MPPGRWAPAPLASHSSLSLASGLAANKAGTPCRTPPSRSIALGLGDGFAEALRDVQGQLLRLLDLVNALGEQHELEVAKLEHSRRGKHGLRGSPMAQASPHTSEMQQQAVGGVGGGGSGGEDTRTLLEALQGQDIYRVRELLEDGADPNVFLGRFQCAGLALANSTPLATAVLLQNLGLVHALVEARADPDAEYSFEAGAELRIWTGPASHACVPGGNVHLLKELVLLQADLHACGSNEANLLWQAAYFGQAEVLEFLLEQRADVEKKAWSQDDCTASYTPLHAAARSGNAGAVRVLLDVKASFLVDDGCNREPLDDAVSYGHADVVHLLVSRHADIFKSRRCTSVLATPSGRMLQMREPPHTGAFLAMTTERRIDAVFTSNSPLLVTAVAKGLAEAPELPAAFGRHELIRFLATPGEAALYVWRAVFRRRVLKHWEPVEDAPQRIVRVTRHAAFLPMHQGISIALGPKDKVLQNLYFEKQSLPPHLASFLLKLAPTSPIKKSDCFVPVSFHAGQVPQLHTDLELIMAIAHCQTTEIFGEPGCRAIVDLKWKLIRNGARLKQVISCAEVINLAVLNLIEMSPKMRAYIDVTSGLALVFWTLAGAAEVLSLAGYISQGLGSWYLRASGHSFDLAVLALTGLVIVWGILREGTKPEYRMIFGVCMFFKWLLLLISLRQLRSVGLRILPVLDAMWDVKPFLAVLSMYFFATVNMFFSLGVQLDVAIFFRIYRLAVFGDFDIADLETQFQLQSDQLQSGASMLHAVMRLIVVVVSFVVGIIVMNLGVATLTDAYAKAVERAPLAFMRCRAQVVLDQHALRTGIQAVLCRRWRRRRGRPPASRGRTFRQEGEEEEEEEEDMVVDEELSHVWFCLPEQ